MENTFGSQTLTHPDLKKDFRRTLRKAEDNRERLQEQRHNFLTACSNPSCSDTHTNPKKKCANCHIAQYCSRECQRNHWQVHRGVCGPATSPHKLIVDVFSSNLLMHFLYLFLAVELDLEHKLPGTELPLVGLRVCMGPAEVVPFMQAGMEGKDPLELKDTDGGAPWGILHFRDAYQQDIGILTAKEKQFLEDAKAQARLAGVRRDVHTVLLHFSCDGVQSIFHVLHIPTESVELAKKAEPFHVKSLLRGNFDIPFTKDNILSQLNMTMRNDKANKLKVRARLTKKDVEIMKEAYPPYGVSPDLPLVVGFRS
ncbi:hypothetical protein DFH06DRAFT_1471686 [Mycena polygramma]|nr:hypothetical protein DFH06DRAFT_1471686 [Mycena polygramma]